MLSSASGIQQGDPLGPALFSLGIRELVNSIQVPFNAWYLDDGTLGGPMEDLLEEVRRILAFEAVSGLVLNTAKCEVFAPGTDPDDPTLSALSALLPGCRVVSEHEVTLLGAPLLPPALSSLLDPMMDRLWAMQERLPLVGAHQGLYLLRSSFSACRIVHIIRSMDCSGTLNQLLQPFDDQMVEALETVLGLNLRPREVRQAALPTSMGGLGLPSARSLAGPAVVASMHATSGHVQRLLPPGAWALFEATRDAIAAGLQASPPDINRLACQRAWAEKIHESSFTELLEECDDDQDRARLLAVARPGASDWLHALPADSLGTRLDDQSTRICVGLRLGADLVEPHRCTCGEPVGRMARHGLSCAHSAGRRPRHTALNDILARSLRKAGIPCVLEPPGLSRDDGKRPDGLTLIPFYKGRSLVWDATVTDSLTPSLVGPGAARPGTAASRAETSKTRKYANLGRAYHFSPFAFETLGGPGPLTTTLLSQVGDALQQATMDKRAGTFFCQRLSLEVQRGNAISVLGTMKDWMDPRLCVRGRARLPFEYE